MSSRFDAFTKQGLYLRNWSPKTVRTYQQCLASLTPEVPTKAQLDAWVIGLRERGLTPGGCNVHIRTVNSYLSWLHEEGITKERLKVRLLRAPQRQVELLSSNDLRALIAFRPRTKSQRQTWTLILLLLDTGLRISEALSIERKRVDLENMVLVVNGKGSKERVVPFSAEMRRHLFRHAKPSTSPRLFTSRNGSPLMYRNVVRAVMNTCEQAGVTTRVHPHLLRHVFAATFIRQGGDIFRLSRLLGHASVSTTQIYLRGLGVAELREGQERLTPLRVG